MAYDIDAVRREFPALHVTDNGRPRIYLDAPGGTQVCRRAIDRLVAHLTGGTANDGGLFRTSLDTDALSIAAHEAVADLLGGQPQEIAFGQNMTTLMFAWSRGLARGWRAGDALVLTRMDHDANVAPWLHVARDHGLEIRWLDFDPGTFRYRLEELPGLLDDRVRLVAASYASNALGTVNDIARIVRIVRDHAPSALVHVDAVQAAPHLPVDVAMLGCDSLVASPYKFFGPHQGVLWARAALLAGLDAYKVRPSPSDPVGAKLETGTPSWEGQAGTLGAVEHIEWIGRNMGGINGDRRAAITGGMALLADHETALGQRLLDGLAAVPGLRLFGVPTMDSRVPTFAFTLDGIASHAVAQALADENIFVWSGSFYAKEVVDRLGLAETGLVRVGPCHYNTLAEIDTVVAVIRRIAG